MAEKKQKPETSSNVPSCIPPVVDDHPCDPTTGKFKKGNKAGKGNPFGAEVSKLRAYIFGNIQQGQWDKVRVALLGKAMEGDTKALTLLFAYALGKPVQSVDINVTQASITPEEAQARIKAFFGLDK